MAPGGGQNRAMASSHSFGTLPVVDVAPLLSAVALGLVDLVRVPRSAERAPTLAPAVTAGG